MKVRNTSQQGLRAYARASGCTVTLPILVDVASLGVSALSALSRLWLTLGGPTLSELSLVYPDCRSSLLPVRLQLCPLTDTVHLAQRE